VTDAGAWWERFFTGPWLDVQGSLYDEAFTAAQVDRIETMLGLEPGSRVLDVPCGEGRVARELAARGHRVTGVDITPHFLRQARGRADERGVDLDLHHADMRELPWEDEFDAAVNWWGSFGYFDDDGNEAFVRAGHLVESLLPIYQPHGWFRAGEDVVVLEERRFDMDAGRIESTWTFMRNGAPSVTRSSSMRVYTFHELGALLRSAGFDDVVVLDPATAEPFELRRSTRTAVVATKAAAT
jgi:SAM-dependent methyltransferase